MEQYYKSLKTGLIITSVILVISIGISLYMNLDEPVVLKQYKDVRLERVKSGDMIFNMDYITNANDNRIVERIEFPEIPDLNLYAKINSSVEYEYLQIKGEISEEIIGRYKLVTTNLQLLSDNMNDLDVDFTMTEARLYFSDGDYFDVNIGKINYYNETSYDHAVPLKHMDSSYLSDTDSNIKFIPDEDIEFLEIRSELLEELDDYIEITVDGTDYRDIAGKLYRKGGYINIDSKVNISDNPELKIYVYDVRPELIYKDMEGNIYSERIDIIDYYRRHWFYRDRHSNRSRFMDIMEFLKARGDI